MIDNRAGNELEKMVREITGLRHLVFDALRGLPAYSFHEIYPDLHPLKGNHYGFQFLDLAGKAKTISIDLDYSCLLARHFWKRPWIGSYFKDAQNRRWYLSQQNSGENFFLHEMQPEQFAVRIGEYCLDNVFGEVREQQRLLLRIKEGQLESLRCERSSAEGMKQLQITEGLIRTAARAFYNIKARTLRNVPLLRPPAGVVYLDDYRRKKQEK